MKAPKCIVPFQDFKFAPDVFSLRGEIAVQEQKPEGRGQRADKLTADLFAAGLVVDVDEVARTRAAFRAELELKPALPAFPKGRWS